MNDVVNRPIKLASTVVKFLAVLCAEGLLLTLCFLVLFSKNLHASGCNRGETDQ